jgi:hypothetical protein
MDILLVRCGEDHLKKGDIEYILKALDCHITTLDFAVVNGAGRLLKSCNVTISVNSFIEFVKTVHPSAHNLYETSARSFHSVPLSICRISVLQGVDSFGDLRLRRRTWLLTPERFPLCSPELEAQPLR